MLARQSTTTWSASQREGVEVLMKIGDGRVCARSDARQSRR